MWFGYGDDSHDGIGVELGFDDSRWRAGVLVWVFEVVVPSGVGFRFEFGVFFSTDFIPFFGIELSFFDGSSIEVVDEVSDPVFDSGAFSVHVPVWGDFELDPLVDFIGYVFEASDRIQEFGPVAEVCGGIEDEREASSVLFDFIQVGVRSGVHDHFVCRQFPLIGGFEPVFFEAFEKQFERGFLPSVREVFFDVSEMFHG